MKIVVGWPPNIEAIDAALKVRASGKKPFFCYGSTIFNPFDQQIYPPTMAHEERHSVQQVAIGGPEKWWDRYLVDKQFRFDQELEAHRVEWQKVCHDFPSNRAMRQMGLREIARRLAGPLYGHMISVDNAKREIKRAA